MPSSNQRVINVVAAVINDHGLIFAAQRTESGPRLHKWEFPGGKVEAGETSLGALERELFEELAIGFTNPQFLLHVQHDYEAFMLEMDVFQVDLLPEQPIKLQVHQQGGWFKIEELQQLDFLPADIKIVKKLLEITSKP